MKLRMLIIGAFFALFGTAQAGPFADDFAKCLVENTSESDSVVLVKWLAIAYSSHPEVSDVITIDPEVAEESTIEFANLVTRLIAEDCPSEAKAAISNEGPIVMETAFNVLGQSAGIRAMNSPEVAAKVMEFAEYIDADAISEAVPGLTVQ